MPPLVQELLALLHALWGHGLDLARSHNPRPKEVPNHEVALVAQDGSDPSHAEKRKDVEPAALRKEPGRKQQRVTR